MAQVKSKSLHQRSYAYGKWLYILIDLQMEMAMRYYCTPIWKAEI